MADKKKDTGKHESHKETSNADDALNVASKGAVLPDPEEIKLPPLHKKEEEHRTVIDVSKPRDNNTNDGSDEHAPFDYRRNK